MFTPLAFTALILMCVMLVIVGLAMDRVEERRRESDDDRWRSNGDHDWQGEGWDK